MIGDAITGTLAIVLTWFYAPDKVSQVLTLWGLWQPVVISAIVGIAVEDSASIQAAGATDAANIAASTVLSTATDNAKTAVSQGGTTAVE